jgi:copper resistance protein B
MGDMAYDEMVEVMGMDDRARFGTFALDRLEYVEGGAAAWSAQAWHGGDVDRFVLRSEGEHADGGVAHADLELLWGHAIAPFWDSRLGLRQDFGRGPDRTWVAFGMQGLAPYWFDVSATAYVGARGRTALRVEADYDLLLTQRLVLQPRVEVNAYGKDDPEAGIGSGLSDASVGVRLRYEIRREFAPYVGLQRSRLFGGSAEHARADGEEDSELQWVAGVRAWF